VQGYIIAAWGESENRRKARFYTLTPKGKKQLEEERALFDRVMAGIAQVMQPVG
jgi:DNA-binding PadR family transcriptional regulator